MVFISEPVYTIRKLKKKYRYMVKTVTDTFLMKIYRISGTGDIFVSSNRRNEIFEKIFSVSHEIVTLVTYSFLWYEKT